MLDEVHFGGAIVSPEVDIENEHGMVNFTTGCLQLASTQRGDLVGKCIRTKRGIKPLPMQSRKGTGNSKE
jgi:hypothetical protein